VADQWVLKSSRYPDASDLLAPSPLRVKRTILCWLCSAVSLFAGTPWPHVDYKEVRGYAWKLQKPRNFPFEKMVRADFWMFSAVAAVAGVPLPQFHFSDGDIVVWSVSIPDPVPQEWLIRPDMSFARGVQRRRSSDG
jgi:hypothetical protein